MSRRFGSRLMLSCVVVVLAALPSPAQAVNLDAVRAELKAASERFTDVEVALAEGYIRDPHDLCITAEMEGQPAEMGAMGIHFFRPDMLGITATEPLVDGTGTHTDFLNPSVVLYEPQADGSLELVAVENLVFAEAWHATNDEPPSSYGHQWDHMIDDPATEVDEAHGFQPHYELHAWVFRDNPNGLLTPFNPDVTCAHHTGATH